MRSLDYEINMLCKNPILYSIDNFLSLDECSHIIKLGIPNLERGIVIGKDIPIDYRTNKVSWIELNTDKIIEKIVKKVSKLVSIDFKNAERLQFVSYENDEKFGFHTDYFPNNQEDGDDQRLVTALIYLNDVEENGETYFPMLDIKIKPKMGKILIWKNTIGNSSKGNIDTKHGALPVYKGRKFAVNLWFRNKELNNL